LDRTTEHDRPAAATEDATTAADAEAEGARAELEAANTQLRAQGLELERSNQQLQDQASELEMQAEELQATTEELAERTTAAERAAAALAESEARYRLAVDAAQLGTWTWDLRTDAATFDARVRELFAFGGDDPWPRLDILATRVHPDDRERVSAALQAAADPAGDGRYEAEYRIVRPDGSERWAVAAGLMQFAGEGADRRPAFLIGTVLDVTAHKQAEATRAESERQLRTLADAIPTLAWTARADGYIDWYNARWYEYTGTTPAQMAGWGWQSVHDPAVLPRVLELWTTSIATGVPFEMTFPLRGADGRFRPFLTRVSPVRDADGHVVRWFGTNTDVEAERAARDAAEAAAARTARLQALTAALAGVRTLDDVAAVVVAEVTAATGATTGMMALRLAGADEAVIVRHTGFTTDVLERYARFPLTMRGPAAVCLRTGEPQWAESRAELLARFPDVSDLWDRLGTQAIATVPLAVAGDVVGTMSFTWAEPRTLPAEDRDFFVALGRQGAQAIERARLFEAERAARQEAEAARQEAEAARQRVAFLAEASARLAGSLDVEATLRTVADLAVPALADWCFLEVREDDGTIRPVAVVHRDPAKVALAYDALRRYPVDPAAAFGTGHVLRTGQPELAPDIPDEVLAATAQDAEHLALVRAIGFRSSLSVPLAAPDGRPVAVLSLVSGESGRRFGPADLAIAEEVARRAAAALASARLYAAEQAALRRATVLQQVTAALSGALTAEQAAALVVEQSAAVLNAEGGVVLRAIDDGVTLEVLGAVGYPADAVEQWRRFPTHAPVPLAEAVRAREAVFVESAAAWRARFGASGLVPALSEGRSWAALPLVSEGQVLGAMGLSFRREGTLAAEDRAFVTALAQQCAQALERARLFAAERAARAEAEVARAEAEAANRAKSEFLAVMSHELRTPLNAIGGYAELLELGIRGPVTDQQREDLARIQRSQRHLLGLINGVLNYTRVEAGAVHYAVEVVLLDEVLATCEALTAPQVRAKGLTLRHDACDRTLQVRADREKVQQIVLNLLSNAVKFTEPGGRVTLDCAAVDGVVAVHVTDTGRGIAADQRERVFQPFVQVDASLTRTQEGVGLGLAISRDLARGMGGDLTVESTPGVGSTFTLTLPSA